MASNEAFVTLATNDTYALGALVLAHSLRRVGTSRQLALLITSDVTAPMTDLARQVFDHVQLVNLMDSGDETKLALMKRPELGVTFTKINCWLLTQYTKCVFMDADTLVLKNCDELFDREELSAVPDVGWPDCFNSGMFVFQPSKETYEGLVRLAESQGSFDGGDQGLLNAYFSDWATKDIQRHLSFIYNMNSNAFYTYLPAFKRFGQDVKIVHFLGAMKPWHHRYNIMTGSPDAGDSGHHMQHLQSWWDIFMDKVQPQLKPDCAGLAGQMSELTIKTAESLRESESFVGAGAQARQFAWERGHIDYMGADAFENIQKRLDEVISISDTTPSEQTPAATPASTPAAAPEAAPPTEPAAEAPVAAAPAAEAPVPTAEVPVPAPEAFAIPADAPAAPAPAAEAPVVPAAVAEAPVAPEPAAEPSVAPAPVVDAPAAPAPAPEAATAPAPVAETAAVPAPTSEAPAALASAAEAPAPAAEAPALAAEAPAPAAGAPAPAPGGPSAPSLVAEAPAPAPEAPAAAAPFAEALAPASEAPAAPAPVAEAPTAAAVAAPVEPTAAAPVPVAEAPAPAVPTPAAPATVAPPVPPKPVAPTPAAAAPVQPPAPAPAEPSPAAPAATPATPPAPQAAPAATPAAAAPKAPARSQKKGK